MRTFRDEPLSIAVIAQLAWAAQGVTQKADAPPGWAWGPWQGGRRTAPSAGALYPLELYVLASNVDSLLPGLYRYRPQTHELLLVAAGDRKSELVKAVPRQEWLEAVPCMLILGAVVERTQVKFGERAPRYIHFEVGHVVENICLQAAALDLGSTMVGSFRDDEVKRVLGMGAEEEPLAIVPVGKGTS